MGYLQLESNPKTYLFLYISYRYSLKIILYNFLHDTQVLWCELLHGWHHVNPQKAWVLQYFCYLD